MYWPNGAGYTIPATGFVTMAAKQVLQGSDSTDFRGMLSRMSNCMGCSENVILFPLCDQRGRLMQILTGDKEAEAYTGMEAESLFLAWLVELPDGMDAEAAARTLLTLSAFDRPESCGNRDPEHTKSAACDTVLAKDIRRLLAAVLRSSRRSHSASAAGQ